MKIIDFHAHIYPDRVAEKATQTTSAFYEVETVQVGSADGLVKRGTEAGISEFVILPVATKATQVRSMNKFVLSKKELYPQFHVFGTIHAETKNKEEELEFLMQSGIKGIKLHPDTQHFNIDDERLFPVYDYLSGKLPVLMHCGDPRFPYSHPERLKKVLHQFPDLQIIAAHWGGWKMYETGYEYLHDENCYVDLSSSTMELTPEQIRRYVDGFGSERILFGTDFPLWDPVREVETFLRLPLTDAEKENIAWRNAERLLSSVSSGGTDDRMV